MRKTNTKQNHYISSKDLADVVGESYDTIDHWSDKGLLRFQRKGRIRFFDRTENIKRCKLIRKLQNEGLNLAGISKALKSKFGN